MKLNNAVFIGLILLLIALTVRAQQPTSRPIGVRTPSSLPEARKNIDERHFFTAHPELRPTPDGTLPGIQVLAQHNQFKLRRANRPLKAPRASVATSSAVLPGFAFRPALPGGLIPDSVVTGDFNLDGKMDFIVANGLENDLWIFLGKGDGTFQLPRTISLSKGKTPVNVQAADLRRSGTLDLVVAESDSNSIGILRGNGDGTFQDEIEYALPAAPDATVVADFDKDGYLDIVAVLSGGNPILAFLKGTGQGTFSSSPTFTSTTNYYLSAWNLAAGDVNGDGLPDVLVTGPDMDGAQIYINKGDGTFTAGQILDENSAYSIVTDGRLVDLDGDGCLDAVTANADASASIWKGDCSGNFSGPVFLQLGDSQGALRLSDVNGDGIPDLVATTFNVWAPLAGYQEAGNLLIVALGDGKGSFGVPRTYVGNGQAQSLALGDFNGDGKLDVVTPNFDTDSITYFQNDGAAGFGFPQGRAINDPANSVRLWPTQQLSFADLNGDSHPDVFLVASSAYSFAENYATTYLNDGTGRLGSPIITPMKTTEDVIDYRLGDFRNTGHLDLIAVEVDVSGSTDSQFLTFLPGNGDGSFGIPITTNLNNTAGMLTTADFNKDGHLDFATLNGGGGSYKLTVFLGKGNGTFTASTPLQISDSTSFTGGLFSGDFNGDGKPDLLAFTTANVLPTTAPTVWEFLGNGDGTFQPGRQMFNNFQLFGLADLNGDNRPDIVRYDSLLSVSDVGPQVNVYLAQSDGSFSQSTLYAPYVGTPQYNPVSYQAGDPQAFSLIADYNGDGKPDILAIQRIGDGYKYAQVLAGDGNGRFTPTYNIYPFSLLGSPSFAHDLDGDGKADLVQLTKVGGEIHVIKGAAAAALQLELEDSFVTGYSSCGMVYPNVPSASDRTVTLSSSVSGVQLPSSVTIPANALSAKFCYNLARNFDWHRVFDVNAQLNGDAATAYAAQNFYYGFYETLSTTTPASVYPGQSTQPVTVTLTSSLGFTGQITLSCSTASAGDSCTFASNPLLIVVGAPVSTTVTFNIDPRGITSSGHYITVTASDGVHSASQTVEVGVVALSISNMSLYPTMIAPGSGSGMVYASGIPPFSFSCSGLPTGAACGFQETQSNDFSSQQTATVSTQAGVAPGAYPFTVNVASANQTASANATLQLLSYDVQTPAGTTNSTMPGASTAFNIKVFSNLDAGGLVNLSCTLDVGGTCQAQSVASASTSGYIASLVVTIPSNASIGQHTMTVTLTQGSYSKSFSLPYLLADFSGALGSSSVSMTPGGVGSLSASLTSTLGFQDTITLSCSGSTLITCSSAPISIQLGSSTSQTATLTIQASSQARLQESPLRIWLLPIVAVLLPFGFLLRKPRPFLLLLILAVCGSLTCCGGSGASGGGAGSQSKTNYYSITISATAGTAKVSHSLGTLSVSVTH